MTMADLRWHPRRVLRLASGTLAVCAVLAPASSSVAQVRRAGEVRVVDVEVAPIQRALRTIGGPRDEPFDLRAIQSAVVPESILDLVDRLDDDDWTIREKATRDLHDHEAAKEVLLKVLDQGELTEEQRQRLMTVLARRIREQDRGAIGIRMSPVFGLGPAAGGGVEVTEVLPDLPAERVLRPADVIVRIDDREIRRNEDLIEHVQQLPPGRVIRVRVLRPRKIEEGVAPDPAWVEADNGRWLEPIEVEFALGSHAKLNESRSVQNPETLRRERLVMSMRNRWDSAAVSLNGQGTIDGVVPPENARP